MIIIGVADILPDRIRRLVYWNAFVPNDGESVTDMVPKEYVTLFDAIARQRALAACPGMGWFSFLAATAVRTLSEENAAAFSSAYR